MPRAGVDGHRANCRQRNRTGQVQGGKVTIVDWAAREASLRCYLCEDLREVKG